MAPVRILKPVSKLKNLFDTKLARNKKGVVWQPMFWSFMIVIFAVFIMNFVIASFIDLDTLEPDDFLNGTINFVDNGFELDIVPDFLDWLDSFGVPTSIPINPFSFLGDTIQDHLIEQLEIFSLVPNWIMLILGTALILGVILFIVSFARGTGG